MFLLSCVIAIQFCPAVVTLAEDAPVTGPYKVLRKAKVGGEGGFDYVCADSESGKIFIPRNGEGGRVAVYDINTLESAGEVANVQRGHGVAVDPKTHHGFSSSKPVVMFDTHTLATIKTIEVQGSPDGILFDPGTDQILVLSHSAPNVTVIKSSDGTVVGTFEVGGAPEQGASDGKGKVFICVEDKAKLAVVDMATLKVVGEYDLSSKAKTPAGLALDVKNNILFACCREPGMAVILNATDGKIISSVPIGSGVDAASFNPETMEAFTSQRDGTLTVIKEKSPTTFEVEQNVQTMTGARTSSLDTKTGKLFLITAEQVAGQRRQNVPGSFTILEVGK
jgi:DNA-binding beta-propeller fold protein YncE